VAPDPDYWPRIFEKIGRIQWEGFSKEELASIKAPVLIIVGDHDFVRPEHSVEGFKLVPNAELAVIPDASHFFVLFSEHERVIPVVKHFRKNLRSESRWQRPQPAITLEKADKTTREKSAVVACSSKNVAVAQPWHSPPITAGFIQEQAGDRKKAWHRIASLTRGH